MLNLASLKYRRVLAREGGPIAKIVSTPVSVSGRNTIQANAFLAPGLAPRKPGLRLNEQADGAGANDSARIACHIAVSEALEHWALLSEYQGPNAVRYGFIEDRPCAGMAAFPGLFKSQARRRAQLEALERLAVIAWWEGRYTSRFVPSPVRGVEVVHIQHPLGIAKVVVVFRKSKSGHVSYGRAAGETLRKAIDRAVVKLADSEFHLTCHKLRANSRSHFDFFQRRCLHFASPEGHTEFLSRVGAAASQPPLLWTPLFDGEIVGPWSRYATVWRTAFRMPANGFLDPSENFFFW